ncbi:MAG: DUF5683 domain-containing protein [Dysgonomonas sp.]
MNPRLIFFLFILSISVGYVCSQNPVSSSEKMKPDWLIKELPNPRNTSYHFLKTEAIKPSLEEARNECLNQVTYKIARGAKASLSSETKKKSNSTRNEYGLDERIETEYILTYKVEADTVSMVFKKIDEYWEAILTGSGVVYQCHSLYAVAENPEYAAFDQITFSYKYGGDALWRSALVPGFGQIYKGHKAKGISIMGGEALLIGGIIFCESRRSDFQRKSKETLNIDKVRNHLDNADNYATYRNICIGAAAALYVYNLIDAVVTDGRKKTSVKPGSVYIIPSATQNFRGVSLSMNF